MTIDEFILTALKGGKLVTVQDIAKRFEPRIRHRSEKLRVRGIVIREGRGGSYRKFTYGMLREDLAAEAMSEAGGGLAHAEKAPSLVIGRLPGESDALLGEIASRRRRETFPKVGAYQSRRRRKQERDTTTRR
jgi:hypothetical protein